MKQIWFVIMFAALAGGVAFAGEADFNGEWIARGEDIGGSGIIANVISEYPAYSTNDIIEYQRRNISLPTRQKIERVTVIPANTMFDFAANGSKLTGSIIRNETEDPISGGKISGNTISFTVKETVKGKNYSYFFLGELSKDGIKFEVTPQNNGNRIKFIARRLTP